MDLIRSIRGAGVAVMLLLLTSTSFAGETRGIRTNNPGNIVKTAIKWKGEVACSDKVNECFSDPYYGIRAMTLILDKYYNKYGLRNVSDIVRKWGPPQAKYKENVRNYIRTIRTKYLPLECGMDYKEALTYLIAGIIYFENGKSPYSIKYIRGVVNDTIRAGNATWECPNWRPTQVVGNEDRGKAPGTNAHAGADEDAESSYRRCESIWKGQSWYAMDTAISCNLRDSDGSRGTDGSRTDKYTGSHWVHGVPSGIIFPGRERGGPMEIPYRGSRHAITYTSFIGSLRPIFWWLVSWAQSEIEAWRSLLLKYSRSFLRKTSARSVQAAASATIWMQEISTIIRGHARSVKELVAKKI